MATEIERKFLLKDSKDESWKQGTEGTAYQQGYIPTDPKVTVRVRIAGTKGYLTIKREPLEGSFSRAEYEYEIPLSDAQEMISTLCKDGVISKTRYKIPHGDHIWEIDVFH
jgi:adenylate cyclase